MSWKKLFWAEGTPPQQKWLIVVMLAMLLGCLPAIFFRDFVPSPVMQRVGLGTAAVLLAVLALWLRHMYQAGIWAPAGPWPTMGRAKRWAMAPLCALFFLAILWINMAVTLPMAYTRVRGMPAQAQVEVQAHRSSSARSGCRYQFKVTEIRFMFFQFCLEREAFNALPSHPMPAVLELRETALGRQVLGLRLQPQTTDAPFGVAENADAQPHTSAGK